ncbi:MAG: nicotinate-nicotinamide nucleotide adenylyltransferase [Bdellovibrionales bacterium]|nr:nicotinate-nicotinamide nucleotide adenylyltransferase [Bdellovibrionales bacterium]
MFALSYVLCCAPAWAHPVGRWALSPLGRYLLTETPEGLSIAGALLGRPLRDAGELSLLAASAAAHPDRVFLRELERRVARISPELERLSAAERPDLRHRLGVTRSQAGALLRLAGEELRIRAVPGGRHVFVPPPQATGTAQATALEFLTEAAPLAPRPRSFLLEHLLKAPRGQPLDHLSDLVSAQQIRNAFRQVGPVQEASEATWREALRQLAIDRLVAAPGHRILRNRAQVENLTRYIRESGGGDFAHDPVLINIVTDSSGLVRSVDLWNAHHRCVAYMRAGARTFGEIPAGNLRILRNGRTAWGEDWSHYVPSAGVDLQALPEWVRVPISSEVRAGTLALPGALANFELGSRNTVGKLAQSTFGTHTPKIGFYFGTFDPMHEGHVRVIRAAIREQGFDEVLVIPNVVNSAKPGATEAFHRVSMASKRLLAEPRVNVYTADGSVLSETFGRDRMAERVRQIYGTDDVTQIIGEDSFRGVIERGEAAITNHRYYVFPRRGSAPADVHIPDELANRVNVSPTLDDLELSSTRIREWFSQGAVPPSQTLHPSLVDYIRANGLYGAAAAP